MPRLIIDRPGFLKVTAPYLLSRRRDFSEASVLGIVSQLWRKPGGALSNPKCRECPDRRGIIVKSRRPRLLAFAMCFLPFCPPGHGMTDDRRAHARYLEIKFIRAVHAIEIPQRPRGASKYLICETFARRMRSSSASSFSRLGYDRV